MLTTLLFVILTAGIGLFFLFSGYTLFRILLPIWGFVAGLVFGVQALDSFAGGGLLSTSLGLIVGVFFGLILAAIAYFAYELAVYIWSASIGFVLGQGLMLAIGFDYGFLTWMVGVVVAIGMVTFFMRAKLTALIIIVLTALSGAMAIITGLFVLFGQVPTLPASMGITATMVSTSWFWMLVWAIVAGFGIAIQYAMFKERDEMMKAMTWEEVYGPAQVTAKS